jgi:hypothetical protein
MNDDQGTNEALAVGNHPVGDQPAAPAADGSHAGLGAMYRGCDGAWTCAQCDYEMEWEDCHSGCEDGYFDGYEEDPNWYHPGELVSCHECGGEGGSWWCPNPECATGFAYKKLKARPAPNTQADQRHE